MGAKFVNFFEVKGRWPVVSGWTVACLRPDGVSQDNSGSKLFGGAVKLSLAKLMKRVGKLLAPGPRALRAFRWANQFVHLHDAAKGLELEMADQSPDQRVLGRALDVARRQHLRSNQFVKALQTRGQIRVLADGGEVETRGAADVSHTHDAGVQSDASAQREAVLALEVLAAQSRYLMNTQPSNWLHEHGL